MLCVIDGIDGAGKDTLASIILNNLTSHNHNVLYISHPNTNCFFGNLAMKFVLKKGTRLNRLITFLFTFLDIVYSVAIIKLKRRKYDDFILVRYTLSACYLTKRTRKIILPLVNHLFPVPDVKIYLDIEVEYALKRIDSRSARHKEMFESKEDLNRIRTCMQSLANDWITLPNNGSPDDLLNEFYEHVAPLITL